MANEDHVRILKQGADKWNKWRIEDPQILIDLTKADLSNHNLSNANLIRVNLREANLSRANLSDARFRFSNLSGADLRDADLSFADFNGASLIGANLTGATVRWTVFININLNGVEGLDSLKHEAPSSIGIDTLYLSAGRISEPFLHGCGVPDIFITVARSLIGKAIDFYSCFISHSSKNFDFAERLYADLQDNAVRCWYAPEDLKIGDKFRQTIDEAIRIHDKLLIVLSADSITSDWVEDEVESALERERRENRHVLFPVSIDDAVMDTDKAWAASLRRMRHIGDFSRWKDLDSYRKAFDRLLRDLKAESNG